MKLYISNFILLLLPLFLVVAFNAIFINILLIPKIFIILFSVSSIIIIFINIFLTFYITKTITERINIMTFATKQIKEGNLDYVVDYDSKDEFFDMMQEFNEMRLALKSSIEAIQTYDEEKKQLTASIVHDLKTPLSVIIGCSQGLIDNIAKTEDKRNLYIKNIYDKANHIDNLVDNLLLQSKLEHKAIDINLKNINVVKYIEKTYAELKLDFFDKNIELVLETNVSEHTYIFLDILQMKRVIQNIIENSVKYKKGDKLKITILARENKENIIFKISDNGIGIKDGEESKIFEKFYRGDVARKFNGGSGLGLTTVKNIINNLNGKIWSRKNNDGGLSIYMSFSKGEQL